MENTKELNKVAPEKVTLKLYGKEREIKFGFSAWAKLEKELGGLKNITKLQEKIENEPFTVIPHLMYLGLLDKAAYTDEKGNSYPEITEENILEEYGLADIELITNVFEKALYGSMPQDSSEEKKPVETEAML